MTYTLIPSGITQTQFDDLIATSTKDIFNAPKHATAPTGTTGDIYRNTTDSKLYFYNGTAWVEVNLGLQQV